MYRVDVTTTAGQRLELGRFPRGATAARLARALESELGCEYRRIQVVELAPQVIRLPIRPGLRRVV